MSKEAHRNTYEVCLGPIHPAFKEPVALHLTTDGERVLDVDIEMGINHRGIEWIAMNRMNPIQAIYIAERVCGICSTSHPFAYCQSVEAAAKIPVPDRAHYIRMIIAELERIHSHILWAGVAAHELGFDTLLHLSWKVREEVMDVLELITGNRVNYAMFTIGGVRRDITDEQVPRIRKMIAFYRDHFETLRHVFMDDLTVKTRSRGIGVLTYDEALKWGAIGPTGRASGVARDVRVDRPYAGYGDIDLECITPEPYTGEDVHGDVYDRIVVRLYEVAQSLDIIEFCLDHMPPGEIVSQPKVPVVVAQLARCVGEGIGRHEAPRGEVFHYVRFDNAKNPKAWKVKAPTYNNLATWPSMLRGDELADVPIIAASIDPCIACADRMAVTDARTGDARVWSLDELRRLSWAKTRRMIA